MCPRPYLQRPVPEGYLDVKGIIGLTGFSTGTIYSWFKEELLPYTKSAGGEYLVQCEDLKKFLQQPKVLHLLPHIDNLLSFQKA